MRKIIDINASHSSIENVFRFIWMIKIYKGSEIFE